MSTSGRAPKGTPRKNGKPQPEHELLLPGVHIASVCGATAGNPCSATDSVRPLLATRITPEYSGVISYFRNLYQ